MPVWPFRSRSIRHRTFGTLKPIRNGKYWRSRLPLPHPAGEKRVAVHISAAGRPGPTVEQESLFLRLSQQYPNVYQTALHAVHGEYLRVSQLQPQLKWPSAADIAAMEALTPLDHIWLDDHAGRDFVLSFGHSSDKEHSFHVFFKDGKLASVASER
jgi:hypothetical protein